MNTFYIDFPSDINTLQTNIMNFVDLWGRKRKIPTPRSEIIKKMQKIGINMPTTRNAIHSLLKKGYLREAHTMSNKTSYVQLRTI